MLSHIACLHHPWNTQLAPVFSLASSRGLFKNPIRWNDESGTLLRRGIEIGCVGMKAVVVINRAPMLVAGLFTAIFADYGYLG